MLKIKNVNELKNMLVGIREKFHMEGIEAVV